MSEKEFNHPFIQSIKDIGRRLDDITKLIYAKKNQNPEYIYLDNADILHLLKISAKTAKNWRDKGILPFSRVENKFYYKLSDIRKLIEANYNGAKKNEV